MGAVEKIKGKVCEHSWECRTGCGLLHGRLSNIAKAYDSQNAEKILEYEHDKKPVLYDFQYRLAVCQSCGQILSLPVFQILGEEKQIVGACPDCGEQAKLIEDLENAFCPVCHKLGLVSETIGMWD